jgi:lysyl-tRNA synthetase class 2
MALSEQEILRREALTELRNLGIDYPAAEFITTAFIQRNPSRF